MSSAIPYPVNDTAGVWQVLRTERVLLHIVARNQHLVSHQNYEQNAETSAAATIVKSARNLMRVFFNFWTRFLWQCSPIDNRPVTGNGKFPDKISRFTRNSHERCDGRL